MAEGQRFVCGNCQRAIEAWSDGNPYYLDESGHKKYAYHPSDLLALCIGNDSPHLCLACGTEFKVDSRAPRTTCRKCGGADIVHTWELEGRRCPYCKVGTFAADPEGRAIS